MTTDPTKSTPEEPAKDTNTPPPAKHAVSEVDKETEAADVRDLLSRHTFDGKGDNAVPPSDFKGFSTEGVEKGQLKDSATIAQEVLNGNWGPNSTVVVTRLSAAGYDDQLDEIEREFNERKLRGAPSAF